jgi:hypothetical protein
MAITWEINITAVDEPNKIGRVEGIATDDSSGQVYTVSVANADLSDGPSQSAALDILWAKFLRVYNKQQAVNSFLSGLEAAATTNLNARSPA